MEISNYRFSVSREPLAKPFAFKGSSFTEKWLTFTTFVGPDGFSAAGVGGLAVLWSDDAVFHSFSEAGGNILMSAIAERGAQLVLERSDRDSGANPIHVLRSIVPELHGFAKALTHTPSVRETFVWNSLVSVDLALWKLYAHQIGASSFDEMIPTEYRSILGSRHRRVAHAPLITYGISRDRIAGLADHGSFVFKIKLGQPGTQAEMLEKDKAWLSDIYELLRGRETPHTPNGKLLYYLDANGRYEQIETMLRLLDHTERIGMRDEVLLLEEPVSDANASVCPLGVRVVADESLDTLEEAQTLFERGFSAVALKPAGKTLSAVLQISRIAHENGIPCFVADSACIPQLVEWNKNVAGRIKALPGLPMGLLESNGMEYYRNWDAMVAQYPGSGSEWMLPRGGQYVLDDDFYNRSGCIFETQEPHERQRL